MPSPAGWGPSTDGLRATLDTRLDRLTQLRPDLRTALELQRNLLTRVIELLDAFLAGGVPSLSLPPRYLAAKLKRGIPALHGEPIPLPPHLLSLAIRDFCARLGTGGMRDAVTLLQRAAPGERAPQSRTTTPRRRCA